MIPNPYEKKPKPESIIVDILSRKPGITSKEVYQFFLDKYPTGMTIQGFYKILKQLIQDRVVAKDGGKLSLYSAWVQNLVAFADQAARTHLHTDSPPLTIILEEGESKSFELDTPIDMSTFWDHALLTVVSYCKDHLADQDLNAYSKNYYSWIQLLRPPDEAQLIKLYGDHEMQWSMASGSHSFLNITALDQLKAPNFNYVLYEDLSGYGNPEHNFHVTIIADFIFETKLPNFIFEVMKRSFDSVERLVDLDLDKLTSLISESAKTTLKISRDRKRANQIRDNIKILFD